MFLLGGQNVLDVITNLLIQPFESVLYKVNATLFLDLLNNQIACQSMVEVEQLKRNQAAKVGVSMKRLTQCHPFSSFLELFVGVQLILLSD
jgi:hypothetical protein